jgi:hypothetical protein
MGLNETEGKALSTRVIGDVGRRIQTLAQNIMEDISKYWDEDKIDRLRANGKALVTQAEGFMIDSQEKYLQANEFFLSIAQYDKQGSALIDPIVEVAHHPHKLICDIRTEFKNPAKTAKAIIEAKILAWKESERKRQAAEQARLDAERKAAEARERERIEAKAREEREKSERLRREAEERARIETEKAERARREAREANERAEKAERDKRAAEESRRMALLAQENAEREAREAEAAGREAEARAARERAERERIEERLAQERLDRNEELAISARAEAESSNNLAQLSDSKAQREIDKGEIAAQQRLDLSEAHEARAESVFHAPTIVAPTVGKSEVTSKGTASGSKDWSIELLDEMEILRAVIKGINDGGFPISVLALDTEKMQSAFKRWARTMEIKRYERNGVRIVEKEKLSARVSSKAKE